MKWLPIIALGMFSSCSMFTDVFTTAGEEEHPNETESYLSTGPNTDIELGQDERTLLEDFKQLNDQKVVLETQLSELKSENEQLRSQLHRAETERDQFRNNLAASSADGERVGQRARDLEAKVLSLNIEKTLLEQELLRLRISSLRQQYEDLVAVPTSAAPPKSVR